MSLLRNLEVTPSNESERCCICLHVRFATILLGCYLAAINASFILFVPIAQSGLVFPSNSTTPTSDSSQGSPLLSQTQPSKEALFATTYNPNTDQEQYVGTVSRVEPLKHFLHFAVAMMLVYGAYSYKSMYLMPFICIRFFQLLRTVLGVAAWLTHAVKDYDDAPRDLESELMEEEPEMETIDPFTEVLGTRYGFLASVLFFFVYLNILVYTLSIVWRCYKFILRRNRENMRRLNNLHNQATAAAGSASFWGPDGSVNPPVAANWLNEIDREENSSGEPVTAIGAGSAFKLPNYSEVAKDPEGKKFMIVNIPQSATGVEGERVEDDLPGYSGSPEEYLEDTAVENGADEEFDGPPPSYDQISVGPMTEQVCDGYTDDQPTLFNGTLTVQQDQEQQNSAA